MVNNKGAEAPLFNSTYFLFRVCVKADPATDFSAGVDLGSRNIAEALLATEGLVFSLCKRKHNYALKTAFCFQITKPVLCFYKIEHFIQHSESSLICWMFCLNHTN